MKLMEFKLGDTVPDGARLVHTKTVRGRYLDTKTEIISRGFFHDHVQHTTRYEPVEVFVYEVPDVSSTQPEGE